MSKRAWVTLATNDSYGLGALVLAHSLRRTGSQYPAVVLITPSVTQPMKDRLSAVFAEVITVDVLDSKDAAHLALLQRPELGITFTKIHCWNLTQYEKCVFLDADTLVVQNSDELFERVELSAAPDVGWPDCFNSGVFVFQPSPDTFDKLIKFAQERGSFDGGDQGLLNSFFSDWAQGDSSKRLPFVFNVTSAAFYSYLPALKHYGQNLKIIHFIGAGKPWLQQYNWESGSVEAPEHLREFLQLWWNLFVENVHAQLDVAMSGVAGNLARVVKGTAGFQRDALDELTRRQGWEAGNIDYMGADSFDNIWAKISQTLSQPRSSPPKQSPPRESAPSEKQPSPVKESAPQSENTNDGGNVVQEPVTGSVEIAQEAVALDTPVTDAAVTVSAPVLSDVTLKTESSTKAVPAEGSVTTDTSPANVDVVEIPEAITESTTKIIDEIPGEHQAAAVIAPPEETATKDNLPVVDTSLTEQIIAVLETPVSTEKESTILEKEAVLEATVAVSEPESQINLADTSVPSATSATVAVETPVLVESVIPVLAEVPVSKEQPSSEVAIVPEVESKIQEKPVSAPLDDLLIPLATDSIVLPGNNIPSAAESPASTIVDESTAKEPLITEKPTSLPSDTPIEAKAEIPTTLETLPSDAVASQTSEKAVIIPPSLEALPPEAVAGTKGEKTDEIPKGEPAKKIDCTSKVPHTPPTTPKSTPEATTPVAESALKSYPLDTTQKIVSTETPTEAQKTIAAPIVTPASPVSTGIPSPVAPILESTPEKLTEALEATDSPPLANTPSKEEAPVLPAAKSEERRKPVGKLQLSPPTVADPLPTPDSELEDAATLAQSIIASELKTPTVSSPSPSTVPTSPLPPKQEKRLSVEEPEVPTPPVGAVSLAQIGVKPSKGKPNTAAQIESSVTETGEPVSKTEKTSPSKTSEPGAPADVKKKAVKKAAAKEGSSVEAPVPPPRKKEKKPK